MVFFKLDILKLNLSFDEIELLNNQKLKNKHAKKKKKKPRPNL